MASGCLHRNAGFQNSLAVRAYQIARVAICSAGSCHKTGHHHFSGVIIRILRNGFRTGNLSAGRADRYFLSFLHAGGRARCTGHKRTAVMIRRKRNNLRVGVLASRAGMQHHACLRTGRFFRHLALVPGMLAGGRNHRTSLQHGAAAYAHLIARVTGFLTGGVRFLHQLGSARMLRLALRDHHLLLQLTHGAHADMGAFRDTAFLFDQLYLFPYMFMILVKPEGFCLQSPRILLFIGHDGSGCQPRGDTVLIRDHPRGFFPALFLQIAQRNFVSYFHIIGHTGAPFFRRRRFDIRVHPFDPAILRQSSVQLQSLGFRIRIQIVGMRHRHAVIQRQLRLCIPQFRTQHEIGLNQGNSLLILLCSFFLQILDHIIFPYGRVHQGIIRNLHRCFQIPQSVGKMHQFGQVL